DHPCRPSRARARGRAPGVARPYSTYAPRGRESMMSWTRTYRLALYVLPTGLRRKHGSAMERLFARELQRARERSRLQGMAAGAAGIWEVVRRGAYDQVRPSCDVPAESHDVMPWERWDIHAHEPQRAGADSGDPHMQNYTTRQLLRRH